MRVLLGEFLGGLPSMHEFLTTFIWMAAAITDVKGLSELGPLACCVVGVVALVYTSWNLRTQRGKGSDNQSVQAGDRFDLLQQGARVLRWRRYNFTLCHVDVKNHAIVLEAPTASLSTELAAYRATFQLTGIGGDLHATGVVVSSAGTKLFVILDDVQVPPRMTDGVTPICPVVLSDKEELLAQELEQRKDQ
jgi:hypothetical protein